MSFVNIISAIGNNGSFYPLLVRDCGIEIPTKLGLTYKQNLKDSKRMANNAVRERSIDEYGTSAVWIAGPIILDKFSNWAIKKIGYNPCVNMSLFKERKDQGIKYNIEKFKDKAPEAVKDMEKALLNKKTYRNLQAGKFAISTFIPITLMGIVLPKLNYKLTEIINEKQKQQTSRSLQEREPSFKQKQGINEVERANTSFKGISSVMANMSQVNKMAFTDGGLTIGRVCTGRNSYEQMELGFKNVMMMFLNFVFPIYLAKWLNKLSMKLFNTDVNLDPKLMVNKDFLKSIKDNSLKLPSSRSEVIEFLDKNPNSKFAKLCEDYCGVKYLKNRVRDPREFVDTKKIALFKNEIEKFANEARKNGNVDKYAKRALKVKSANIIANVGISSFLLAAALPELIFFLRKKVTGSDAEPGLIG